MSLGAVLTLAAPAACPLCPLLPDAVEAEMRVATAVTAEAERVDLAEAEFQPVWDGGERVRYRLSARLRADAAGDLTPGEPPLETYDPASRPAALGDWGEAELRDAYLQVGEGGTTVRVGKQQLVWGKLYGLKILDAVNPQSFREFILEDFDESRIGLWGVRVRTRLPEGPLGAWTLTGFASPDTTVHRLPRDGASFAFRAPRFRFGSVMPPTGTPASPPVATQRPGGGVYAGRLAAYVGGIDLSLVAISRPDAEPVARLHVLDDRDGDAAFVLQRFHARRLLVGASASTSVGPVALRGEVGHSPSRAFPVRRADGTLGTDERDQLTGAIAADWSSGVGTFSVQLLHDAVAAGDTDLVRPSDETYATLAWRHGFLDDRLGARASLLMRDGISDRLVRAELTYTRDDGTAFALEADLFSGDETGVFGQFDRRDRVLLCVRRVFE